MYTQHHNYTRRKQPNRGRTLANMGLMIGFLITALFLNGCNNTKPSATQAGEGTPSQIQDLHIVDCLLPGQLRRLGTMTYSTPRRPIHTTAADCRIRGGEYVEYDRADYKTALNVWMEAAEGGDPEAQANVGEIFERGLGDSPNYAAAAIWYQKAAEQGNARAQFNLGTLYEQGLGVEKDSLQALNWYRKAWGLEEDSVIYQSAAAQEQKALRGALQKQLSEKNTQITLLSKQLSQMKAQLSAQAENADVNNTLRQEIQQLQNWVAELETEKQKAQTRYDNIPVFREPVAIESPSSTASVSGDSPLKFGKYYALIIGNQNYSQLDNLYSPISDAQAIADVLEDKYGFSVKTLLDASNVEVMQAINDLNDVITDQDNLLIFYAGHGSRVKSGEIEDGYWLPVNANPPPKDTYWVSNEFITRHLARLNAKRVLVVADSCYAGLLSSAPGYLFMGSDQEYTDEYIEYKLKKKARLLLASGGDKPVLDNAGSGHSVFARALLTALEDNNKILSGPELYTTIKNQVEKGARKIGYEQSPEFKAIKGAGHEVGDFFFVPQSHQRVSLLR
ncbi:caspase family protein [Marinibactrum halimedae]|uniref:Caspase family p20 domain-containing protein n=1 Tax=Marinibactrum halimedae TaxID=1444977 RepID=A0AA37T954_9GAMM|nr:caspase family protein [Marinibactrum halimedae]MCD9457670.1 caspase family protein [Marinibactrum halimedae]GLS24957.1 hypothetical protein GCM10007877_06710 [Marinibactrum halimedae]